MLDILQNKESDRHSTIRARVRISEYPDRNRGFKWSSGLFM